MYCRIDAGSDFGNFIVEKGEVNVDMKTKLYPSGTPLNEALAEFFQLDTKIAATIDSIRQSIIQGKMDRETRIRRMNELESNFDIYNQDLIQRAKKNKPECFAVASQTRGSRTQ